MESLARAAATAAWEAATAAWVAEWAAAAMAWEESWGRVAWAAVAIRVAAKEAVRAAAARGAGRTTLAVAAVDLVVTSVCAQVGRNKGKSDM